VENFINNVFGSKSREEKGKWIQVLRRNRTRFDRTRWASAFYPPILPHYGTHAGARAAACTDTAAVVTILHGSLLSRSKATDRVPVEKLRKTITKEGTRFLQAVNFIGMWHGKNNIYVWSIGGNV
jgi:hypothetical protein